MENYNKHLFMNIFILFVLILFLFTIFQSVVFADNQFNSNIFKNDLLLVGSKGYSNYLKNIGKVYAFSSINGRNIFSWTGRSEYSSLGFSVAAVGDIDKDGYFDALVSSIKNFDDHISYVYLYSGQTGDIIRNWISSPDDNGFFGHQVGWADDVDHDGYDDLFVTSPQYKNKYGIISGRVVIYSGRNGNEIFSIFGENNYDFFGYSASCAGDVNNDGHPDIIVGAPYWDPYGNLWDTWGKVYVYSGDLTLPEDQRLLCVWEYDGFYGKFGFSVSGLGDVNRDGYDDVVIGALGGKAYVYSGKNYRLLYSWFGENNCSAFGISVSGVGDVNNDGYMDVIVGSPQYKIPGSQGYYGKTYVYSGKDGQIIHSWIGESLKYNFGYSVSGAGDVNRDGYMDIFVGTKVEYNDYGRAYVYDGVTGNIIYKFKGRDDKNRDQFGSCVSGMWQKYVYLI